MKINLSFQTTWVLDRVPTSTQLSGGKLFDVVSGTGLFAQFGVNLDQSLVPYALKPNVTYHQALVRRWKDEEIDVRGKRFSYGVPLLDESLGKLAIKLAVFPPCVASVRMLVRDVDVEGDPNTDATELTDTLIRLQRANQIPALRAALDAQWRLSRPRSEEAAPPTG